MPVRKVTYHAPAQSVRKNRLICRPRPGPGPYLCVVLLLPILACRGIVLFFLKQKQFLRVSFILRCYLQRVQSFSKRQFCSDCCVRCYLSDKYLSFFKLQFVVLLLYQLCLAAKHCYLKIEKKSQFILLGSSDSICLQSVASSFSELLWCFLLHKLCLV